MWVSTTPQVLHTASPVHMMQTSVLADLLVSLCLLQLKTGEKCFMSYKELKMKTQCYQENFNVMMKTRNL